MNQTFFSTNLVLILAGMITAWGCQSTSEDVQGNRALLMEADIDAEMHTFADVESGEVCVPVEENLNFPLKVNKRSKRRADRGNGNHSPTGIAGDNMDDLRSGKVDCYYDGNSGQGDDKKHGCTPPPGCDTEGCCVMHVDDTEEVVVDDGGEESSTEDSEESETDQSTESDEEEAYDDGGEDSEGPTEEYVDDASDIPF